MSEVQIVLDASDYQGEIPYDRLPPEIVGIILKATDGARGRQKHFARNWREARAHGRLRGAYHWFQPGQSTLEQAKHHYDVVCTEGYEDDDLPPSLDLEDSDNGAVVGRQLLGRYEEFMLYTESNFDRFSMTYSGTWFWNKYLTDTGKPTTEGGKPLDSELLSKRPYWHSAYPSLGTPVHAYREAAMRVAKMTSNIAHPWQSRKIRETIWQFDGDGGLRLPNGVDVDVNIFHGTMDDLRSFIRSSHRTGHMPPVRAIDPGVVDGEWRIGGRHSIEELQERLSPSGGGIA